MNRSSFVRDRGISVRPLSGETATRPARLCRQSATRQAEIRTFRAHPERVAVARPDNVGFRKKNAFLDRPTEGTYKKTAMLAAPAMQAGRSPEGRSAAGAGGRQTTGHYRILVIEDDPDIAELIRVHLEDLPACVEIRGEGLAGLEAARSGAYDLVALDLRLPGLSGLEVCRRLRQQGFRVPILMVSARAAESDRIVGLEIGADDYVVKPFSPGELLARARALLRRSSMRSEEARSEELVIGDLRIDRARRSVHVGAREVPVTPKEFDLLHTLAAHPGKVFSKAELLRIVWGLPYEGYEHNITIHVNRLRAKIEEDPASPRRVLTVWGIGYKMAE